MSKSYGRKLRRAIDAAKSGKASSVLGLKEALELGLPWPLSRFFIAPFSDEELTSKNPGKLCKCSIAGGHRPHQDYCPKFEGKPIAPPRWK